MGMLSVSPLILSITIFTPLATHAKKMQLLTSTHHITGNNTNKIDALGQTTSAVGNGFATGAALLSASGLLFLLPFVNVNISAPMTLDLVFLAGILVGIVLPFVFSGYLLRGLSRGILGLIREVMRQFREISYLYEHKGRPDIAKASDEQARLAMDSLVIPGILMVIPPIVLGYVMDYHILVGMGLGAFLAVFSQSFFWTHTGDALHNAKHYISGGRFGGKTSPTYAHVALAENVGDGFKDLLGPALNIWLKSVAMIIVLLVSILAL
jgi:K(+)-stimulated pyrophosphate-energized sodium pump